MTTKSSIHRLVLGLAVLASPLRASAEPPPTPTTNPSAEELARARELSENGETLYAEGSYDAAIAAFKSAYEKSGDAVLLYNIALAYDRAGKFDEALEYLEYYRAFAPADERESLAAREDSLRKRRLRAQTEATEANAAEDTVDAGAPTRDGEPSRDPAPGRDGTASDTSPAPRKVFTPVVWTMTAVSLVALGVGTGLGVASLRRGNAAEDACLGGDMGPICPDSSRGDVDSARRLGLGADVSFAIGGVAGVVAIALIVNNAVKRNKAATRAQLVPQRGGIGASFRF